MNLKPLPPAADPVRAPGGAPLLSSLRWRLSASITGVVLLCAALCIAGAVIFLRQALTDRAIADLRHTLQGVTNASGTAGLLHDQRDDLLGAAELVAADPSVANAVRTGNRGDLIVHLTLFYADLNADVLDVIDAHGRIIVRMEDTLAFNDMVTDRPGFRGAMADHETAAVEVDQRERQAADGYALRATVPLHDGPKTIGAVVVGRQLNSIFAKRIADALNVNVDLIAGNQRTGTTLTDQNGLPVTGLPEPATVLARIAGGKSSIATMQVNGQPALSGLVPLLGIDDKPVGAIELISPLGPFYDVITKLSYLLLALGALVVVGGTMLALGIGRRLTKRLLTLEVTAAHVARMAHTDAPLGDLRGAIAVRGEDEVASLAHSLSAMMIALDERMAANAHLYSAAQARVHELSGLAEVARLCTAGDSIRDTLDSLGTIVCRLVGCVGAGILVPGKGMEPPIIGGHGLPDRFFATIEESLRRTAMGEPEILPLAAIRQGRVLYGRFADLPESHKALRDLALEMQWGGATAVPLRVQGERVGALTCFTAGTVPLSESNLSLLTTVTDQVAVAVENARLHASARDLAALEERARLARELHDSVTQAIFSMTLHARAAQMALQRDGLDASGPLARSVTQLNELTQGALAEMRALIFELRPGALGEEGLTAALRKQVAAISAREGLSVDLRAPLDRLPLDAGTEEQLYRLALEALHNAVKHANAGNVTVRLEPAPDNSGMLLVEISDDGQGFDTKSLHPGHLGLGTMADRARQLGGSMEIRSTLGQGTTVSVVVPLALQETENDKDPARTGKGIMAGTVSGGRTHATPETQ